MKPLLAAIVLVAALWLGYLVGSTKPPRAQEQRIIFDAIKAYQRGELMLNDPGEPFTNHNATMPTNIIARAAVRFLTNEFGDVNHYISNGFFYPTPEYDARIKAMAEESVNRIIENWRSVGLWDSNGFVKMPHDEKMKRLKQLSEKQNQ